MAGGSTVDPHAPCLIGVGQHTWHREDTGAAGAPEPLEMSEHVARLAADDTGLGPAVLEALEGIDVVYCQTWQYDDAVARLAERISADPRHRFYSGIGGTTPQVLVQDTAARILAGELDVALVVGAEALATQVMYRKRGERPDYSFPPPDQRPYPWEAPFHPADVAHDLHQAWLTFAIFDSARRARLGTELDAYRRALAEQFAPFTRVAAANPNAWYRIARDVDDILVARPDNRMVGYPYTKYMISVMDVDMAAALMLTSHAKADELGVPAERRVYLRGWCYATDPVYVAEHDEMSRSPAMAAASAEAFRVAGIGVDDCAHLDLYSCFPSSVNFGRDALGIADDDSRALTVTGGLPYHGGAASNYMTHQIATMTDVLRADPGAYGLVTGVGMHMTKHVYGVYSTEPGPVVPPERARVQAEVETAHPPRPILVTHEGEATVAAYSVVHGREGIEWGIAVCDVDGDAGARTYAKLTDPELLAAAEETELVARRLRLTPGPNVLPTGAEAVANFATLA